MYYSCATASPEPHRTTYQGLGVRVLPASMRQSKISHWLVIAAAALALTATSGTSAAEDDTWQFAITPYVWLPSFEGTGDFETPPDGGGQPEVEVGPVDYLEHLEFALMLAGEARKGKW